VSRRILQIIPTLDRGGAEKQLALLAAKLDRREFEVHVCALTRGGPLAADLDRGHIPYTVIGKRWKFDPAAFRRLLKYVRSLRPDLVQTWLFAANSYGRLAARRAGVPTILACERCADRWKASHELAIDRLLARSTDRIIVNSRGVRDFYVARGLPAEKFVVIPNGIELPRQKPILREELLAELKLPPGTRLIGAVGRLWPQKRIKDLIWAADLLKVIRDDVHLLVIGDGPLRRRIERFRYLMRIEDKVHLLGHRDDVPRLMPHFDVLWLASGYEGLPNSVMEAMSHAVPVVATNIPGNRDLIEHGKTGYLVSVGDRAAFARWTQKILDDPQLAQRLGQAGQEKIRREFTIEKMIDRFSGLYQSLLP